MYSLVVALLRNDLKKTYFFLRKAHYFPQSLLLSLLRFITIRTFCVLYHRASCHGQSNFLQYQQICFIYAFLGCHYFIWTI